MPLDDSGAWEQRSEDVHVLDMERKPRRKSYGYHIRSAPVSADDDDLAGLPGISKSKQFYSEHNLRYFDLFFLTNPHTKKIISSL